MCSKWRVPNSTESRHLALWTRNEFQESSAESETPWPLFHLDLPCQRRRAMKRSRFWWGHVGMNLQGKGPRSLPSRRFYEKPVPKGELGVEQVFSSDHLTLRILPLPDWGWLCVAYLLYSLILPSILSSIRAFLHSFLHSFIAYALSAYHMQSTVLRAGGNGVIHSPFISSMLQK